MELDFFNPRSVLIFVCLLQGAVFIALLVRRGWRKRARADWWLAALLFFLCASLITPFIGFANVYDRNQWLTYFPFHFAYIYGVCVYFYALSLTNARRTFTRRDRLLFIPTALYVAFRLGLFAQSDEFKGRFDKNYYVPLVSPFVTVTEMLWNAGLLYLTLRHYRRYRAWLDENFSDTEKLKFDWLRNFLYLFAGVFIVGWAVDLVDNFFFPLSYIQYFYFELLLAGATYYLALAGYLRSETIELRFTPETVAAPPVETLASGDEPPRRNTALAAAELERLKARLVDLMSREKLYLEPQLTLSDVARRLGLNSNVVSHVINQGCGKNFNDFVNEYRVTAVKEKLGDGTAANLSLLGVALECGFNSKATFNRAFKKITGVAPKDFPAQTE